MPLAQRRLERRIRGRRRRREDRRHLELAAPQAGRDLQRQRVGVELAQRRRDLRLGQREEAQDPLLQRPGARQQLAQRRRRDRVAPTSSAARAAARAARRPAAPSPRAARARSRPARARRRPRARCACLRAPARIASSSHGIRARSRVDDRPDALLERRVVLHRRARPRRDDVGGEVVGGRPEPAAGDDQVDASPRGSPAPSADRRAGRRRRRCARRRRRARAAARTARARWRPDQPGEHLGAGDDDARADAHVAQSPTRTGSESRFGFLPGRNS